MLFHIRREGFSGVRCPSSPRSSKKVDQSPSIEFFWTRNGIKDIVDDDCLPYSARFQQFLQFRHEITTSSGSCRMKRCRRLGVSIDVTVQCEIATVVFSAVPSDVQSKPPALGLLLQREECAKDVFAVLRRDSVSVILIDEGQKNRRPERWRCAAGNPARAVFANASQYSEFERRFSIIWTIIPFTARMRTA